MTVYFANYTLWNMVSITRHKNIIGIILEWRSKSSLSDSIGFYVWDIVGLCI